MSEESSSNKALARFLRPEEVNVLKRLLSGHPDCKKLTANIEDLKVRDMSDGGMGSIRFLSGLNVANAPHRMGQCIAEGTFQDQDGILVSIAVNIDKEGELFEIDVWKTNFDSVQRYPDASDIENIKTKTK